MKEKLAIGCDHAGFELKELIVEELEGKGYRVEDKGTHSKESVDYPDFVHPVATMVQDGEADLGLLICGSGNGVAMTANKHREIRAALCWNEELSALARQHNNANVLCLPSRFIDSENAVKIVNSFLDAEFEGGRHARRVEKISRC